MALCSCDQVSFKHCYIKSRALFFGHSDYNLISGSGTTILDVKYKKSNIDPDE